jgi:hypothetical protein
VLLRSGFLACNQMLAFLNCAAFGLEGVSQRLGVWQVRVAAAAACIHGGRQEAGDGPQRLRELHGGWTVAIIIVITMMMIIIDHIIINTITITTTIITTTSTTMLTHEPPRSGRVQALGLSLDDVSELYTIFTIIVGGACPVTTDPHQARPKWPLTPDRPGSPRRPLAHLCQKLASSHPQSRPNQRSVKVDVDVDVDVVRPAGVAHRRSSQ